jgi:hypothetical protein
MRQDWVEITYLGVRWRVCDLFEAPGLQMHVMWV